MPSLVLSHRHTAPPPPPPPAPEPPPRNPRRLSAQTSRLSTSTSLLSSSPSSLSLSLSASSRHPPSSIASASAAGHGSRPRPPPFASPSAPTDAKLAAQIALERAALRQISPPSSPEEASGEFGSIYRQVSPIEDDNGPLSPVYCVSQPPQDGLLHDGLGAGGELHGFPAPGAAFFPPADGYSSQASAPRSPQMQFAALQAAGDLHASPAPPMRFLSPGEPARGPRRVVSLEQAAARHYDSPHVPPLSIPRRSGKRASFGAKTRPDLTLLPTPESASASASSSFSSPSSVFASSFESPRSAPAPPLADRDVLASKKLRRPMTLSTPPSRAVYSTGPLDGLRQPRQYAYPTPPPRDVEDARTTAADESPSPAYPTPDAAKAIRRKPPPPPLAQRSVTSGEAPSLADLPPRRSSTPARPTPPTLASPASFTLPPLDLQTPPPPDAASTSTTSAISPKPFSSHAPRFRSHIRAKGSLDISLRPASILFIDKPLPLAPPELSSLHDRIAHLRAVLAGLALRRANIAKSIRQMTLLMPADNLLRVGDVLEKREREKRKVLALREELAEVQRLEHDLGLKLHRAYKRQEREDLFEPTTLWVNRRETS